MSTQIIEIRFNLIVRVFRTHDLLIYITQFKWDKLGRVGSIEFFLNRRVLIVSERTSSLDILYIYIYIKETLNTSPLVHFIRIYIL